MSCRAAQVHCHIAARHHFAAFVGLRWASLGIRWAFVEIARERASTCSTFRSIRACLVPFLTSARRVSSTTLQNRSGSVHSSARPKAHTPCRLLVLRHDGHASRPWLYGRFFRASTAAASSVFHMLVHRRLLLPLARLACRVRLPAHVGSLWKGALQPCPPCNQQPHKGTSFHRDRAWAPHVSSFAQPF